MILIVLWDGVRPDMISPERTPYLAECAARGTFCRASHAAFPTATRINSASLATGCYPGKHGIVDNELYVPGLNAREPISCADWRALQAMADLEGGRLLTAPTIGELLRDAGRRMVSGGSGSPGTTYLTNPTVVNPIVNWAVSWPQSTADEMAYRYNGPLPSTSTSTERNRYVLRAMSEYLIPTQRPDLATIWLTEPDHTQHYNGLRSPEALVTLRELDDDLRAFVREAERLAGPEGLTCFLISDHGFDTIAERPDPEAELVAAGFKAAPDSTEIVSVSNSFYLNSPARERLSEIVAFLGERPWVGALMVRDDLLAECPNVLPQSAVFCNHQRSAEVMVSYRWWDAPNAYGTPGSVSCPAPMAATHGSASPYATNNTLVAWGAGIKEGVMSDAPCGIVDIAPTVLYLLGIEPPASIDGRILREILRDGPAADSLPIARTTIETACGSRRQMAHYSAVEGYRYLDRITIE